MEVILLKNIEKVGRKFDIVKVKDGYGRNYLIPQGLALVANERNRNNLDSFKRQEARKLEQRIDLVPGAIPGGGPARYLQVAGTDLRIGFITPISQHFCETCNRVRLSVDGTLYLCLGQDHKFELRPLLRGGASDQELQTAIRHAVTLKPERHEFTEKPSQVVRFMSATGG